MKSAVFVEGHTEALFVKTLIYELAGLKNVAIIEETFHGGFFFVTLSSPAANQTSEVLIANCCNNGKVVTAIRDRYASLIAAGYQAILGLRDLYPQPLSDLQNMRDGIASVLPQGPPAAAVHIAISELEAWFIEEETHFARIDPSLDRNSILAGVNYDIASGMSESIPHPAGLLDSIYKLAGLAYRKKAHQIVRTVSALDFGNLYFGSRARAPSLDAFVGALEAVLI